MKLQLYGLKTCDTCRKALKSLSDVEFVDIRSTGVPDALMAAALAQFGDKLINRQSTTWRGLQAQERERPAAELLRDHPALMKRPLIRDGDALYLGWDAATRAALGVS